MATPKTLLTELYWSFFQRFENQQEFEAELITYNTRLLKAKPKLEKIVFPEPKIVIQFLNYQDAEDDDPDYDEEQQILLETNNPKGFTLSELMFKINNSVVENEEENIDISEQDSVFFEGLEYLTDDDPNFPQTKVYFMILGS